MPVISISLKCITRHILSQLSWRHGLRLKVLNKQRSTTRAILARPWVDRSVWGIFKQRTSILSDSGACSTCCRRRRCSVGLRSAASRPDRSPTKHELADTRKDPWPDFIRWRLHPSRSVVQSGSKRSGVSARSSLRSISRSLPTAPRMTFVGSMLIWMSCLTATNCRSSVISASYAVLTRC